MYFAELDRKEGRKEGRKRWRGGGTALTRYSTWTLVGFVSKIYVTIHYLRNLLDYNFATIPKRLPTLL